MRHPILFEINTRCWLHELSADSESYITLGTVPDDDFHEWQRLGFTHIWLMGVWTSGKRAREQEFDSADIRAELDLALPDWTKDDVAGSPYSISGYHVPRALGGDAGLKRFRSQLHQHGLKLILDFVPNHLAPDHPWVATHPERFVQCDSADGNSFIGGSADCPVRLCHGRDPYFAPWNDTVQLDYRRQDTRAAMLGQLESIAQRCDGVRCDMAMLVINEIFFDTWKNHRCRETPVAEEFWPTTIRRIREQRSDFLFLAEAYWNRERQLIQQGFDFAYHKQFTDAIIHQRDTAQSVVLNNEDWLNQAAHFLENHDEQRVAAELEPDVHRAAALAMLALPGMRFLHEGQLRGWKVKTPVRLAVRRQEETDTRIAQLYERLLKTLNKTSVGNGDPTVLKPVPTWDGNDTAKWMLLIEWHASPEQFHLVAINFAPHNSQCYARISIANLAQHTWRMDDLLSDDSYERDGEALQSDGLYLDLPAYGAQCYEFNPIK
jgi:hypothetical protein